MLYMAEFVARNLTEEERKGYKEITWDSKEVCGFYMVRFCPHDLFVNTRSDLGGFLLYLCFSCFLVSNCRLTRQCMRVRIKIELMVKDAMQTRLGKKKINNLDHK